MGFKLNQCHHYLDKTIIIRNKNNNSSVEFYTCRKLHKDVFFFQVLVAVVAVSVVWRQRKHFGCKPFSCYIYLTVLKGNSINVLQNRRKKKSRTASALLCILHFSQNEICFKKGKVAVLQQIPPAGFLCSTRKEKTFIKKTIFNENL